MSAGRRLPASGWQHGQHIAITGERLDRAQLAGTKLRESQPIARQLLDHGFTLATHRNQDPHDKLSYPPQRSGA
jgi:hypothetical protein